MWPCECFPATNHIDGVLELMKFFFVMGHEISSKQYEYYGAASNECVTTTRVESTKWMWQEEASKNKRKWMNTSKCHVFFDINRNWLCYGFNAYLKKDGEKKRQIKPPKTDTAPECVYMWRQWCLPVAFMDQLFYRHFPPRTYTAQILTRCFGGWVW